MQVGDIFLLLGVVCGSIGSPTVLVDELAESQAH